MRKISAQRDFRSLHTYCLNASYRIVGRRFDFGKCPHSCLSHGVIFLLFFRSRAGQRQVCCRHVTPRAPLVEVGPWRIFWRNEEGSIKHMTHIFGWGALFHLLVLCLSIVVGIFCVMLYWKNHTLVVILPGISRSVVTYLPCQTREIASHGSLLVLTRWAIQLRVGHTCQRFTCGLPQPSETARKKTCHRILKCKCLSN